MGLVFCGSSEEFFFMVYKELDVFLIPIECTLSSVESFRFFQPTVLFQEMGKKL